MARELIVQGNRQIRAELVDDYLTAAARSGAVVEVIAQELEYYPTIDDETGQTVVVKVMPGNVAIDVGFPNEQTIPIFYKALTPA